MSSIRLQRFWVPSSESCALDEAGFLADPEGPYGKFGNANLKKLSDLEECGCLVLLGEAGSGKTTDARTHLARNDQSAFFDLRSFGSEDRLIRKVFDENERLKTWKHGASELTMTFDSVDECLIRIDTLASILEEELRALPCTRLKVRFLCRTAAWPPALQKALGDLWPKCSQYEIAPLRLSDVRALARAEDVDPERFIRSIFENSAVGLALTPLSASFLVQSFSKNGNLPSDPVQLYASGLQKLAGESSDSRVSARQVGSLNPRERVFLAARLAALMLLCGRNALARSSDVLDPLTDAYKEDLAGGEEVIDNRAIAITPEVLDEILDCGLFTGRGEFRLGFAHHSYMEYCAALFLQHHDLSNEQCMDLLTHHEERARVVPQLEETAVWLARLSPSFLEALVESNPDLALRGGAGRLSNEVKTQLIDNLLEAIEAGKIYESDLNSRYYVELGHPGLATQLRPNVTQQRKAVGTRRVAIAIATEAECTNLLPTMLAVALDEDEHKAIRARAAFYVSQVGSSEVKARLRPLLHAESDADDQLFGHALDALWPDILSVCELFSIVKPRQKKHFYGQYFRFLTVLPETLSGNDLVFALRWVTTRGPSYEEPSHASGLISGILHRGWQTRVADPSHRSALAAAMLSRLRHHEDVFADQYGYSGDRVVPTGDECREIVELLVLETPDDESIPCLAFAAGLLTAADVRWLRSRIDQYAPYTTERTRYLACFKDVARLRGILEDPELADIVVIVATGDEQSRRALGHLVDPIDISSCEALDAKERYDEHERRSMSLEQRRAEATSFDWREQLNVLYTLHEKGDPNAWSWIGRTLVADERGLHRDFDFDFSKSGTWRRLDRAEQERISGIALDYLACGHEPDSWWVSRDTVPHEAISACRAFFLIAFHDPAALQSLDSSVWTRWGTTLVAIQTVGDEVSTTKRHLLSLAARHDARPICRAITDMARRDEGNDGQFSFLGELSEAWNEATSQAALDAIQTTQVTNEAFRRAIEELVQQDAPGAAEYCRALLAGHEAFSDPYRRAIAASELLCRDPKGSFETVWPCVEGDEEWAQVVAGRLSSKRSEPFTRALSEQQATRVAEWLFRKFPPTTDPVLDGAHDVGPREQVGWLRQDIMRELKSRGTLESRTALQELCRAFPNERGLKWDASEAERQTLAGTWAPVSAQTLLKLVDKAEARVVRSSEDLLRLIVSELKHIQEEFFGHTPPTSLLWDEQRKDKGGRYKDEDKFDRFTPKDEGTLSDFVKIRLYERLVRRGIVVNREVEIRRGEETDIHVTAVGDTDTPAKVILETKGCWNRDLSEAMQTQLGERYLSGSDTASGIYLVGWYLCDRWMKTDYRRKNTPQCTLDEITAQLAAQATSLSPCVTVVVAFS